MRIAFLNSIEAGTFGGMEHWIQLVSAGLLSRGHSIHLLGRPQSSFLDRVCRHVPEANRVSLRISGDFNPSTISKVKRLLSQQRIDVLCVNFNKDVRLGGIAARLNGNVKVVWSVGINITKDRFSHRLLTPRLIDRVIVPSQSLKEQITHYGYITESTVDVIPIGIDATPAPFQNDDARRRLREKYNLSPDAVVAVTVGRLVYKKGHEYLVEAAPQILKMCPSIYFLFLGDGPEEAELRQEVRRLGIEEHVIFAGMLDNIDLELAGADIMIHPSKEEPFGIALLEGMRAGLPIVASRVGGIPEVVVDGKTAILFEPRSPEAIADAVEKVLQDESLMHRLGQAGHERLRKEFPYRVMIDRVEKVFAAVVESPRTQGRGASLAGNGFRRHESVT